MVEMAGVEVGAGARIAALRAARHLTQHGLAEAAHVSYSLLTKVESGARPATPGFIAACARALGTQVSRLTGQPYAAGRDERLLGLLGPVRAVLDLYDLPPVLDASPRALPELAAAVRRSNRLAQAAEYTPMLAALPGLLTELHAAAHTWRGPAASEAWGLLAEAYRCAHSAGIALGFTDLSATALARMDWAARSAGAREPGLRAAREYLRVTAYLREGDYEACRRLNASGVSMLQGAAAGDPGVLVARGQLHLGAAVIAARTGDRAAAEGNLQAAARLAARTGERTETFWFGFGPTNVAVHRAMTLVELGDYAAAVRVGDGLQFPATWLPTRIGHHHFDQARAYQWMNRPAEALAELQRARAVAPQQARRHPSVHETVAALVRSDRRMSAQLAEFATWISL
jgi:XRE family transcriptional regulator, fatty acid utilization regulator